MNGREHHLVKGSDPQHQQAQQNQSQQADFPGGHTENVADEKVVEFGKALALSLIHICTGEYLERAKG